VFWKTLRLLSDSAVCGLLRIATGPHGGQLHNPQGEDMERPSIIEFSWTSEADPSRVVSRATHVRCRQAFKKVELSVHAPLHVRIPIPVKNPDFGTDEKTI